ncbi:MAG TPA: GAF domain-containing protein [Terriglobia bacterium]|nr:GAF domain-containing protein [Terriglobia bacterium]
MPENSAWAWKPDLPINETARLEALRRYEILDTAPEQEFDDLTLLAAQVCDVPIALISLVDSDRQWFKSKIGTTMEGSSREISFCGHAILQPELFVVPDTSTDVRFATNPLVTAEPHIRFYAGAPLTTTEGQAIGTLCVIDRRRRELTEQQREALNALKRQVMRQLEIRSCIADLKRLVSEGDRVSDQLNRLSKKFTYRVS